MTYRPDEDIVLEWAKTDAPSAWDRGEDVPDPAEVERLRGIEQRAREVLEGEGSSPYENDQYEAAVVATARFILGEPDHG